MPQAHVSQHPAILHKLTRLRDKDTQPELFRSLVEQLSTLLAVTATQDLQVGPQIVHTPLAACHGSRIVDSLALVPILRAGLGMTSGVLQLYPSATVRHLGYYRDETNLQPVSYYDKLPSEQAEDVALVLDPMLATGGSAIAAVKTLRKWGCQRIKFLGIIGAPEGVAALQAADPDVEIFLCGLDEKLDARGYIQPGLGDAGDRQFHT